MNWYIKVIRDNYVNFSGRARRAEYWNYNLFNFLIMAVLFSIGQAIDMQWFLAVYFLAVIMPTLAVAVRRLHDIGKTGWFYLARLIPVIGPLWYLIMLCTDGETGYNEYGPDPKMPFYKEFDDIGKPEIY